MQWIPTIVIIAGGSGVIVAVDSGVRMTSVGCGAVLRLALKRRIPARTYKK